MKKTLLIVALFASFICRAQIVNYDFENWSLDTFYLAKDEVLSLPADTTVFLDPVNWTSSNAISDLDSLGHQILVTQDTNAYSGSYAIKMHTAVIKLPAFSSVYSIVLPGFVVSGTVVINPTQLILNSASGGITPASVPGAGQPINQRLASISGYYNYQPVFNTYSGANDSCLIYATLRKGKEVIANAIFSANDSTGGYKHFSAPFNYLSCDMPDTLVILMASSLPDIPSLLEIAEGITNLTPGSSLFVDSLYYDTLAANSTLIPPFAVADRDTTAENIADTINILANDNNCTGGSITTSIISGPTHGTATFLDSANVVYTPDSNFIGTDSILYQDLSSNGDSARTWLIIVVTGKPLGIFTLANNIHLQVFPVPTSNELNIVFNNAGTTQARIYDLAGILVLSTTLSNNSNHISTSTLANGVYTVELSDETNGIIGRAEFVVAK